jgi:hypothetical protein
MADKFVCIVIIRRFPGKINHCGARVVACTLGDSDALGR